MSNIKIGEVYIFDILNHTHRIENEVLFVQVLEKHNRLFRKPLYTVRSTTGEVFKCVGSFLTPMPKDVDTNKVVMRYPIDMPVFTKDDIDTLTNFISDHMNREEDNIDSLSKILCKLAYYASVNECRREEGFYQ